MRTTTLIGITALVGLSPSAMAQDYTGGTYEYSAPNTYVSAHPTPQGYYDGDDYVRVCHEDPRDRRGTDGWSDCRDSPQQPDYTAMPDNYGYRYSDGYRGGYRGEGGYAYGYPAGRADQRYGYGYGYSGGYSGGYSAAYGGGYVTTQSGGVTVIVEHERGERYIPVIREEIIEETYETTEYETVRERVVEEVPVPYQPRRGPKYIKSVK
jgi:hypothetical protein